MKCSSTKCKVLLLIAANKILLKILTVGTYCLEIVAERKDVSVMPVPLLGNSLSALGITLPGLRRGGEALLSDGCWNHHWWL